MEDTPDESKSQARQLTTTSYGVLSALALRDHSTYELAKQMRFSLHYFWPRAESNVYAEPKRLVAAGLANARREWNGGRRRTIYSITDSGRAALADWLRSPSSQQRYESEALLKVFFAENGTIADMAASIRALRDDATAAVEHFLAIADRYDAGAGEYPHRFAISALVARLIAEQHTTTARWADWAEPTIASWQQPTSETADWGIATLRATGTPFTPPNNQPGSGTQGRDPGDKPDQNNHASPPEQREPPRAKNRRE